MESPYSTTKEVLAYLKISRQTLDRLRKDIEHPFPAPVKHSLAEWGRCLYLKDEVVAWDLERRARPVTRDPADKRRKTPQIVTHH